MTEAVMEPLDQVAAVKHLELREVMMQRFGDPGITKVVGWDGNEPVGLGLLTNDFSLVREISPEFFANRFPERAERDAILYGMAVLVKPIQRGMTMFSRLISRCGRFRLGSVVCSSSTRASSTATTSVLMTSSAT